MSTCNPKIALLELLPEGALPDNMRKRAEDIPITKTQATSLKINVALKGRIVDGPRPPSSATTGSTPPPCSPPGTRSRSSRGPGTHLCRGDWPDTVPVSCSISPTHVDPTQAPEGQDTLWLWSGVIPVHPRVPWEEVRDEIGQKVLADAATYYDGLDSLEIGREVLGGPDLEKRFNAPAGNVYHVDPLPSRFGPLKPALGFGAYETPVDGLFLSGASTHPTGGVCALPGKLAAETLLRRAARAAGSRALAGRRR